MLCFRYSLPIIPKGFEKLENPSRGTRCVMVCAAKGPRPRYPRVWKASRRIGSISKSLKLVNTIKELSSVKEEVYSALDSFVAWELEFPLITIKKAIKILEDEKEWKRIIQVIKWMLSKGQGRTTRTYFSLLNALAQDDRLDEAEEIWRKIFSDNLEGTPRFFFDKMISIYYHRDMHHKMFEIFADMEELGVKPGISVVKMVGKVFRKLGMLDKYEKLTKKYPPPTWEYRFIKGKRVRVKSKNPNNFDNATGGSDDEETVHDSDELHEEGEEVDDEDKLAVAANTRKSRPESSE